MIFQPLEDEITFQLINSVLKGKIYYSLEVLSALRKTVADQLLITRREKEVWKAVKIPTILVHKK